MVGDSLRVGLGEADADLVREGVAVHRGEIYPGLRCAPWEPPPSSRRWSGDRGPAVVLTGAGMSTESGIPDFRSASGIWAEVDPFEVASIDAFRRDPRRVWSWYGPRIGGAACGRAERGARRARRARARGSRAGGRDAEHRPAARARGEPGRRRGARLDPRACLPRVRRARQPLEASSPSSRRAMRRVCSACGAIAEAGRRHVRRAAARRTRWSGRSCSRARRGCSSSSARRSRSGPLPGCRGRPFGRAAHSRS